jgi:NADH-quinone oxidoreductase subunit N
MLCCYQLLADLELVDSSFFDQNDISHTFLKININSLSNLFVNTELNSDSYFMTDVSFVVSGMLIILLALFFKLALAPFHLWSPDVYEGSPSSSTFFFMIISKFSLFVFLLRLCYSSFYSLISYWQFYSLLIATISIFVGAVAGLKQRKLKSLLTYSSINNMGFVLLAFSIGGFEGIQMKFYYLIVYILSGLCIWAIILNLKLHKKMYFEKQNRDIGDLALLQESNNTVAQSLGITLFTLAGLPPMVGFLAKMGVFKALSGVSIYFFSLINILFSVIATFYYIRIVKIIFFENILIGNLYVTINTKKTFIINLLTFFLVFLFVSPMFLYLYSYKITLFLNKAFY